MKIPALLLAAALLLVALMPSHQSLWVDEAQLYLYTTMPTPGAWLARLTADKYSEALTPLPIAWAWVAGKLFGTGEWTLRAANLPWAVLATLAFFQLGRRWRAPWLPLFFAVQPFVWFYVGEARPYAMQFAPSAWLLVWAVKLLEDEQPPSRHTLWWLMASGTWLVGTTLFGIITFGFTLVVLAGVLWRRHGRLPWRALVLPLGVATLVSAGFGVHYLRMVLLGSEGAKLWHPGVQNIAFALYEFIGCGGLGPARNALREFALAGGLGAVVRGFGVSLLPVGLLVGLYGWLAVQFLQVVRRRAAHWSVPAALAAIFLAAVGSTALLSYAVHFPFWGRHLTPTFAFFIGLASWLLAHALHQPTPGWWPRLAAGAFATLLILSSAELRLHPRHAKDDYRNAVAYARAALSQGELLWWAADPPAATYYGLPMYENMPPTAQLAVVRNPATAPELPSAPVPSLVILSKWDLYDRYGILREHLRAHGYTVTHTMNTFSFWRKPAQP